MGPIHYCQRREPETAIQAFVHTAPQRLSYHGLAGNADEQWASELMQLLYMLEQAEIVRKRLGKAEPRVQHDPLSRNACRSASRHTFGQEVADLRRNVQIL